MDQILRELTLYDTMSYLVPGTVVVWAIFKAVNMIRGTPPERWSWTLVVAAYLVGHLVQALASPRRTPTNPPPSSQQVEKVYSDDQPFLKGLSSSINTAFHNPAPQDQFNLCESYVQVRKLDSFAEIMRARYGFFRGLTWSLSIAGIALLLSALVAAIRTRTDHEQRLRIAFALVLVVLCMAGACVAKERTQVFYRYWTNSVYKTFYVDYNLSVGALGTPHPK